MTAMFVVIFLEQWLKDRNHSSELIGLGISVVCLVIFGPDNFIIPAMAAILAVLTLLRKQMETEGKPQEDDGQRSEREGGMTA